MRLRLFAFFFVWVGLGGVLLAQDNKPEPATSVAVKQADTADDTQTQTPESKTRVRFGGFSVSGYRASYPHWSPFYYPYWHSAYYGWSPFLWDPWIYPGHWMDFRASANRGRVKFEGGPEDAELSIDGAYAGVLKDLKTIWLDPGAYNVELRIPDRKPYQKRIYVLTGKTVTLTPTFEALPEAIP